MAQLKSELQGHIFCYKQFCIDKSQPLGHGSYGAVYKATCDQLPCAAKVLHPTILDPQDPGSDRIMKRFRQECEFLNKIRHPHIVMYLGMTKDSKSKLPVLLMELLDESLTKMLERSKQPLPYHIQVDLSHDVALAIAYLHSNDIIHRDLSSNNVLISAGRRAKVTDFGMSRLMGEVTSKMTPLTMCPGTHVYMPPEALKEPPTYTKKLDCFSEGVLMIQTCTQLWPVPGPRTKNVPYVKSPTGKIEMPVLETERRKAHIDLIAPNHPLLPIVIDCLSYDKDGRPSAEELCEKLITLKTADDYIENVLAFRIEIGQTTLEETRCQISKARSEEKNSKENLQREIERLREEIKILNQKLHHKGEHNDHKAMKQENERSTKVKKAVKHQISLEHDGTRKELSSQLNLSPRVGLRSSKSLAQLSEMTTNRLAPPKAGQLPTQPMSPQQRHLPSRPPPPVASPKLKHKRRFSDQQVQGHDREVLLSRSLDLFSFALRWKDGVSAPNPLSRGAAVVDGDLLFVVDSKNKAYIYGFSTKKWSSLPDCPHYGSCLAVVNGLITAIGGTTNFKRSLSKLLSLKEEHKSKTQKWIECLPAMPTERWNAAAVTSPKNKYLIVVGGKRSRCKLLNVVEVLNIKTMIWSAVASLPQAYTNTSVAICGDRIYVLGGEDQDGRSSAVTTCSLTKLLSFGLDFLSNKKSPAWQMATDAPAYFSTCAAVDGELFAIGGQDKDGISSAAIYKYNPIHDTWNFNSSISTARYNSIVAVVSHGQGNDANEIMVIGGCSRDSTETKIVDTACFN